MKKGMMLIAALLTLTACGTDSGAQQAELEMSEPKEVQVIVTKVIGNMVLAAPAEGTEESHASDCFILSSDELPPEIQPAADMRLKVTYDGSVLETDPAQFSGIEKIEMMPAVVQEETDAPVPASASGGDISEISYEIDTETHYPVCQKRGYYTVPTDSGITCVIASGEKSTGGYAIQITEVKREGDTVVVVAHETSPAPSETVTEAFTYPMCAVHLSEQPETLRIQNTQGVSFEHIGAEPASSETSQIAQPRRAVMVDGILYLDTGYVSSIVRCGNLDGTFDRIIDPTEIPDNNGEANFPAQGWQGGFEEDTLDVYADGEFCIFGALGTPKGKQGYIPQGVMQFTATVEEAENDGYVLVRAENIPEQFPMLHRGTSYRLDITKYDRQIYSSDLVPGNVVFVLCKGIPEGEAPVTIPEVYTFYTTGSAPCQSDF